MRARYIAIVPVLLVIAALVCRVADLRSPSAQGDFAPGDFSTGSVRYGLSQKRLDSHRLYDVS